LGSGLLAGSEQLIQPFLQKEVKLSQLYARLMMTTLNDDSQEYASASELARFGSF
jgi:hypothetical protein